MKQLVINDFTLVHVEITLGLKGATTQFTTRDVTEYLKVLNRERVESEATSMTFKVFSGYAPYLEGKSVPATPESGKLLNTEYTDVIENVALLHLDYNPEGMSRERFDTLAWFLQRLMEKFEQTVAYAHFALDSGHRMLVCTLEESKEEGPAT